MSEETKPIDLHLFVIAIKDISSENCQSLKSQLRNSISKLFDTNDILNQEITQVTTAIQQLTPEQSHDELKDDLLLYLESVDENNEVILNQKSRIFALNDELVERGEISAEEANKEQDSLTKEVEEKLAQFEQKSKLSVIYNLVKSTDIHGNERVVPAGSDEIAKDVNAKETGAVEPSEEAYARELAKFEEEQAEAAAEQAKAEEQALDQEEEEQEEQEDEEGIYL